MFAADQTNTNSSSSNNNGKADFEKAKGFVNVYLPTANGGRVKLGTLPLRDSNKGEKAAFEYLAGASDESDFNARLANLVGKMQFEYNAAEGKAVELAL